MTAQALDLLSGRGGEAELRHAAELLRQSMEEGCGRAAHQLAVLSAVGFMSPPDWSDALGLLGRSAELGFELAQAQLRLLSAAAADRAGWSDLARAVDVQAWLSPPAKRSLSEAPRVRTVEGFAPPEVCDWLMDRARGRLTRASTYSITADRQFDRGRTNSETDFTIVEIDVVMALVRARIGVATGLPTAGFELAKVLHYAPGQKFEAHFDCLNPALPAHVSEIETRGQRIATFLLYLNDDYEGGETDFIDAGLRHHGVRGEGLFFANVDLSGAPDFASVHQGLPPTSGEKWILSQWIRNRPQ